MEKRTKALFLSIIFTIHTIKVKTRLPLQYKYQDYQTWVLKKTEFLFHNHFTHPHQKHQTLHGLLESWKRQSSYFYPSLSRTHKLVTSNLGCRSLGTVWTCRLCGTIPPRGNPHRGCCSPSTMMMMGRMVRVCGRTWLRQWSDNVFCADDCGHRGELDGLDHVQVDPGEDEVERLVVVHRDPTRLQVLVVRRRPGWWQWLESNQAVL